jgi:bla regulator protein blaR1
MKLAAIGIATVLGLVCSAPVLSRQSSVTDWEKTAGGKMSFDVASVKRNMSGPPPVGGAPNSNFNLGSGSAYSDNGGLLRTTNYALWTYIAFAYKIAAGKQNELLLAQLPKWANEDRFDIDARVGGNPTKDQMRLMMQSLLADRFKLAVHYEKRQFPVYMLVQEKSGKLGPHLQPHSQDSPPCAGSLITGSTPAQAGTVAGGFPAVCGSVVTLPPSVAGRAHWAARDVPFPVIVAAFSNSVTGMDRFLADGTGLSGTYDFSLEWSPEVPPGVNFQADPNGATFLEALKEQLGLKLEPAVGPVEVLVIDHVEEPSKN